MNVLISTLRRKGLMAALLACFALAAFGAPAAQAEFGINNFDVTFKNENGSPATQAGSHPFALTTSFGVNYSLGGPYGYMIDGNIKDLILDQPRGLVGDATAITQCPAADFLNVSKSILENTTSCADDTVVGIQAAELEPGFSAAGPVYNLTPPPGVPVRLGFVVLSTLITVDLGIKQGSEYNATAALINTPETAKVFGSTVQLWGVPGDPRHDGVRGKCGGRLYFPFNGEFEANGSCPLDTPVQPFLTLPASCEGPVTTGYELSSWENPGAWLRGGSTSHDEGTPPNPQGFTGCGKLGFDPAVEAKPTAAAAETGTGLDFDVDFNDEGLTSADGLAESTAKKVVVTLPEGVSVNPSAGEGLGVCSPADLGRESISSAPGSGCPNSAKIGTVHVDTPLLGEGIDGSVFLAQQDDPLTSAHGAENPFDSLLAFYIVLRSQRSGLFVVLPAEVQPDPKTGQLVTTVEDIPQLPFSHFNFHFREGQRAPLVSPPACGSYTTEVQSDPVGQPDRDASHHLLLSDHDRSGGRPLPFGWHAALPPRP